MQHQILLQKTEEHIELELEHLVVITYISIDYDDTTDVAISAHYEFNDFFKYIMTYAVP